MRSIIGWRWLGVTTSGRKQFAAMAYVCVVFLVAPEFSVRFVNVSSAVKPYRFGLHFVFFFRHKKTRLRGPQFCQGDYPHSIQVYHENAVRQAAIQITFPVHKLL